MVDLGGFCNQESSKSFAGQRAGLYAGGMTMARWVFLAVLGLVLSGTARADSPAVRTLLIDLRKEPTFLSPFAAVRIANDLAGLQREAAHLQERTGSCA